MGIFMLFLFLQQEMKWKHYTYRVSAQLGRCLLWPSGGCEYPLNEQRNIWDLKRHLVFHHPHVCDYETLTNTDQARSRWRPSWTPSSLRVYCKTTWGGRWVICESGSQCVSQSLAHIPINLDHHHDDFYLLTSPELILCGLSSKP